MTQLTVYARGDSSSANNAAINAQGTSTTPVAALTFDSGASGDLALDYNGGLPDPDTTVFVNGVQMTFTVQFTGTLPFTNKLSNVDGVDLRGKPVAVITLQNGQRYFFLLDGSGTLTVMNAFPNGAHAIQGVNTTPPPILICFRRGTLIATATGPRPVESLRAGDMIQTATGFAPLLWNGRTEVSVSDVARHPSMQPVTIPAGLFGPGMPARPLHVSSHHSVMVTAAECELMFGEERVLVPAVHLLGFGAERTALNGPVEYFHLLFDQHETVLSEGLETESLQPTVENLRSVDAASVAELAGLYPAGLPAQLTTRPAAARVLRRHEAFFLLNRLGLGTSQDERIVA